MKKLFLTALLAAAIVGCGDTTEPLQPTAKARLSSASSGDVSVGIADTIYGSNFQGRCDIPLSVLSFSPTTGEFTGGRIIFTKSTQSDTFPINESQMADVVWPIPASGAAFGTLTDDNFGSNFSPPYTGSWRLDWTIGGSNHSVTLNYLCLP
jgi:hypothetical protein